MADVNFTEYGTNALRVSDSVGDVIEFGANNGYELGVLIAIFVSLVLIIATIIIVFKYGKVIIQSIL